MNLARKSPLFFIKSLHTLIWIFFNIVIFYFKYAVIAHKIDKWVWICLTLVGIEAVVLIVFKNMCPVTIAARKYSDSQRRNSDIFLPEWLAKYNKPIYTVIVFIGIVKLVYRLIEN